MIKVKIIIIAIATILISCSTVQIKKFIRGKEYTFEKISIKSNDCIQNDIIWLHEILTKNKILVEIRDDTSLDSRDTRYLDDTAHSILKNNCKSLCDSRCIDDVEKFKMIFANRKGYDLLLRENRYYPGYVYKLDFKKLSDPLGLGNTITLFAWFDENGLKKMIDCTNSTIIE